MTESYHKWYSPAISRDFEMLVFGDRGMPVILFPTSMGRYFENKDQGLINAVSWFLDNGMVKIYCPDSIDALSWYNNDVAPGMRAYNHTCYDRLILNEVLGRAFYETGYSKAIMAGCSFGGYHAANFAFRHPDKVSHMFSMSGVFDIRSRVFGYYDDNVYYNNPVDFLPDDNAPELWSLGIILGTAEEDICKQQNLDFSDLLSSKGISHWLDVRPNAVHDWPVWKEMFPHYLSLL